MEEWKHEWERIWTALEMDWMHQCKRCGTMVDEVVPGVPNVHGAEPPDECDVVVTRQVMES